MHHARHMELPGRAILLWSLARSGWGRAQKYLVSELAYGLAEQLADALQQGGPADGFGASGSDICRSDGISAGFLPDGAGPSTLLAAVSPRDLSMCLWALATLGVRPDRAWWGPVLMATEALLLRSRAPPSSSRGDRAPPPLGPQSLALLVWALGRLRVRPPQALGEALVSAAAVMAAASNSNSSQAGSRVAPGSSSGDVLDVRGLAVVLSGLAWSLREPPSGAAREALGARVGQLLMAHRGGGSQRGEEGTARHSDPSSLDSESLPTLLWAAVRLQLPLSGRQREAAVAAARRLLPGCSSARAMVICCWALNKLGASPGEGWLAEAQLVVETR